MTMAAPPPRHLQAATAARLAATMGKNLTRTGQHMINNYTRLVSRRGVRGPQGGTTRGGKAGEPEHKTHQAPQERRGDRNSGRRVEYPPLLQQNREMSAPKGGWTCPRRKAQTCRVHHCKGAPVFVGGLWKFPSTQLWDATSRGGPGQCHFKNSFEAASCVVS